MGLASALSADIEIAGPEMHHSMSIQLETDWFTSDGSADGKVSVS